MKPIIPNMSKLHYLVGVLILLFLSFMPYSQKPAFSELEFFGNPEESLSLLAKAFSENDISFLDEVVSERFCNSSGYVFLTDRLNRMLLNLNSRSETIEKEFLIKGQSRKLVFKLDRDKIDRTWSVADVFFRENGEDKPVKAASFSPLSYASYFNELLMAIKNNDPKYFGLGPGGKLNVNEIKDLELSLSDNTLITYKNIVIHDTEKPVAFVYITLKDYPCNTSDDKCGWLVEDVGLMAKFYQNDAYVQYLIDNSNSPNLKAPNEINRSQDLTPFQESSIFDAQEANLNSLVFKRNFEESALFKKYIVKSGDNLSSISAEQGVKLRDLKALNNLKGDVIYKGQLLVLPKK
ncbi:MAG: LysM peptidoglycan-binding domain-containing protein [Phaeodactylibacter sp.]|nr:LysM peptidoglycan-binding domain-containing protein [Phaeodactylibacter sp.]